MRITFALILAMFLVSCNTVKQVDVSIEKASESKQFEFMCKARPIAVSLFDIFRSQAEVSDKIVSAVYTASGNLKELCLSKPKNLTQALILATRLYSDITDYQSGVATAVAEELAKK